MYIKRLTRKNNTTATPHASEASMNKLTGSSDVTHPARVFSYAELLWVFSYLFGFFTCFHFSLVSAPFPRLAATSSIQRTLCRRKPTCFASARWSGPRPTLSSAEPLRPGGLNVPFTAGQVKYVRFRKM